MEVVFNIFIAAIMLGYLLLAGQLSATTVTGDILGADGFPKVIAIIGLILLVLITFEIIKKKPVVKIPMFDLKSKDGKAVTLNAAILATYLVLMNYIGFMISTPLFLFSSTKLMGYKKNLALILYTVTVSVILVVVFGKIFYVPLPRGIGIFREASYLIY